MLATYVICDSAEHKGDALVTEFVLKYERLYLLRDNTNTSNQLRANLEAKSKQRCTTFEPTSNAQHTVVAPAQLRPRTRLTPTSNQHQTNLEPTSKQLKKLTNIKPTPNQH